MYSLTEKKIINTLKELRKRTGIISSFLFTEDGFIIAIDGANINENEDYYQSIAAICAEVIAFAEHGVDIINDKNFIKQIKIQAGNQLDDTGFMIILHLITNEIMISVVFPIYLNYGVLLFELNQTINRLGEYFSNLSRTNNLELVSNSIKQS
ncbi:MAG: roadblock/LC7 domain-containing protein [Promethearchaeota archaeon]